MSVIIIISVSNSFGRYRYDGKALPNTKPTPALDSPIPGRGMSSHAEPYTRAPLPPQTSGRLDPASGPGRAHLD